MRGRAQRSALLGSVLCRSSISAKRKVIRCLSFSTGSSKAKRPTSRTSSAALRLGQGWRSDESRSGGVHGYLQRSENLVVVDTACSGAMAAKVVAHELGHFFDPWLAENPDAYAAHRGDCEAVAESVAFVVCAAYGIDAGPSAIAYVASWTDGDASKVRDLAERIDAASASILGRGKSIEVAEEMAA
jgi:hypothetical protein